MPKPDKRPPLHFDPMPRPNIVSMPVNEPAPKLKGIFSTKLPSEKPKDVEKLMAGLDFNFNDEDSSDSS